MPWGPGERAYFDQIGRDVALFRHELLHDFQHDATMGLGRGRAEQRTERTGGPALLADHLAEIFLGDAQLKDGALFPFHLDDLHVFSLSTSPLATNSTKSFIAYLSCSVRENSSQLQRLSGKHVFSKRAAGIFDAEPLHPSANAG